MGRLVARIGMEGVDGTMTASAWVGWVAIAAAVIAIVGLVVALLIWRRLRSGNPGVSAPEFAEQTERVVFIVNPVKSGVPELRAAAERLCLETGLGRPLWATTSLDDPGAGVAKRAVAKGASLVVACGGDGTVRSVAAGLAGTGVPMGIVPLGTGNLLARNLSLPLTDTEAQLTIALFGTDRPLDVGRMDVMTSDGEILHRAEPFLVIGGIGFDAAMVERTDPDLKRKVGWLAYFAAGARQLHTKRLRVQVQVDDGRPHDRHVRTVLIGNCGKLPAGLTLIPDAEPDDGWLDIATLDTRGGLVGWVSLLGNVVRQGFGLRRQLPFSTGTITHERAREITVRTGHPHPVELDGDIVGPGSIMHAWVEHRTLTVRVAHAAEEQAADDGDQDQDATGADGEDPAGRGKDTADDGGQDRDATGADGEDPAGRGKDTGDAGGQDSGEGNEGSEGGDPSGVRTAEPR